MIVAALTSAFLTRTARGEMLTPKMLAHEFGKCYDPSAFLLCEFGESNSDGSSDQLVLMSPYTIGHHRAKLDGRRRKSWLQIPAGGIKRVDKGLRQKNRGDCHEN